MKIKGIIICVAVLLLLFGAFFYGGYKYAQIGEKVLNGDVIIQKDTIIKLDTIKVVEIKEVVKERKVKEYIKQVVKKTDTLTINDTLYLNLPKEIKTFTGNTKEFSYKAQISGYKPNLENLEVFNLRQIEKVVKIKQKPKHWGIGVQVGYGYAYKQGFYPYIGVGVSYNLIRF